MSGLDVESAVMFAARVYSLSSLSGSGIPTSIFLVYDFTFLVLKVALSLFLVDLLFHCNRHRT